ncbi:type VI secretion system baseplate subunit TssG [Acinetobacter shaoyimingii]|uniref:Type VI secretion system baseplate subunit TssG n=1 Tax=Acinetobacter shaoyimingii TaxID=2715164 RepID=A0A6G8RZX2_9GAMM|nr:type VI secretion system baseplate subunit TssG [Acinetobacter shaoyimingii]NHB59144.1 type VI secretion system baseplate subunit TssG [Acinetobacter shaoyimingii]QIO07348.1 type VI secretion system baseplate subunit TssG [Acinetobacter shaoyimingii]
MRSERWWQEASVIDELFKVPTDFDLVQTTRLLRHTPYQKNLKYWADDFRFESSLELNFPKTEVESLEIEEDKVHLTNLVVGLTGMQGALPYSYTNKVKQAPRRLRAEVVKFLGLFNHKLTAQYVDSCITYHLPIRYEVEKENDYLKILHALNGYVSEQHQQRELDDYFAEFAGLMQGQNNTAHALKTMLSCVFKQDIAVEEFIEEKFKLGEDQKTKLGGNQPSLLGINTFCGDTIKQIDGKIEIQIGPLNRETYLQFLPNQQLSIKLKNILKSWCSPTLLVDLRLILDKQEVKPICLTSKQSMGLSQGAFLQPDAPDHNRETRYALIGVA